ncbi:GNAT family N-acetyltransferase [Bradyrhizobium sp. RT3a]|uniref:GNAT family N-acetyltransferase n=1 Tax=unclassified Bradyrhizobium TaxID=2631580 RepID=UPI003395AEA9
MSAVRDNPTEHRFELPIDDSSEIAAVYYRIEGGRLVLTHTEVPQQFSGRGVGSRLARGVFDAIRVSGRTVVLRCPSWRPTTHTIPNIPTSSVTRADQER